MTPLLLDTEASEVRETMVCRKECVLLFQHQAYSRIFMINRRKHSTAFFDGLSFQAKLITSCQGIKSKAIYLYLHVSVFLLRNRVIC